MMYTTEVIQRKLMAFSTGTYYSTQQYQNLFISISNQARTQRGFDRTPFFVVLN